MCGRVGLGREGKYYIDGRFGRVIDRIEVATRFNVPPTASVPLLYSPNGEPDATLAHWGLKRHWWTKGKPSPSNARWETVRTSGMFKGPFERWRGVIPVSFFYEWETMPEGPKQPWLIRRADGEPLLMASIWSPGDEMPSATMITTTPNDFMAEIHDRMPVILEPENVDQWIEGTPEDAAALVASAADGILERFQVSRRVNNARIDDAGCADPLRVA